MKTNLLLVDDHTIVTDGIKALLSDEEKYVIKGEASNGQVALDMLRVLKIDVVLMDLDMPVMSGIDATKIIKKELPEVKVIILTMHDEKALIQTMIDIGADGYLLKNSSKHDIIKAIEDVRNGLQHFSEEVNSLLLMPDDVVKRDPILSELTEREIEILQLIAEGLSNKEIGEKLFISHRTVDTHRTNLMTKLNLHNVAGLVKFAILNGLASD